MGANLVQWWCKPQLSNWVYVWISLHRHDLSQTWLGSFVVALSHINMNPVTLLCVGARPVTWSIGASSQT